MGKQCNQWETIFWGLQKSLQMVTTAMKLRCLLLGREAMINLDSVLKSRNVTFPAKVCLVKAMVFSVVTYRCGSLTIMKAESWRMNVLNCVGEESWECPGLQRDQTSQSQRKSVLHNPWKGWCWGWISNNLATWCKEPTHWKRPWCWERWKAKGEGRTEDEVIR